MFPNGETNGWKFSNLHPIAQKQRYGSECV